MTIAAATRTGLIDWVELTTPDIEGTSDFYALVLGWTYTTLGSRRLAEMEGLKTAGLAPRIPTIGDMPLPAAWTVFVRAEHLTETIKRAIQLGGVVVDPPEDVPEGWRTATILDPTGASLAFVQASPDFGFGTPNEARSPVWCDLMTRNLAEAETFYGNLLGWAAQVDGNSGYTTFTLNGRRVAGMLSMPSQVPGAAPSYWLPYFYVDDVETVARRAAEAGGIAQVAPQAVGSVVFAIIEDQTGAVFGLLEVK